MAKRQIGSLVDRFDLDGADIELDSESLWPALERGGFSRSEVVKARVDELLPLGASLLRSQAMGRLYDVSSAAEPERKPLPEPIRGAEFLAFCISTAGRAIDDRARCLCEEGDLIDSMILDGVAMTGLSIIRNRLGRAIFDWAEERDLAVSRAFSPGAGASHWGLEHQRFLFGHLPERPLGVRLTPHLLMRPSKSVSFVIGIGEHIVQAKSPFSCEGCPRSDCPYRHVDDAKPPGETR